MSIPHNINFLTINDALEWFNTQETAAFSLQENISLAIENENLDKIPESFLYLSLGDAKQKFITNKAELDLISCFQLVSAAEGRLKYDFSSKVSGKGKTPLEKEFRNIFSLKGSMKSVSVEKDILDIWKKYHAPAITLEVGSFKGLMKLRHWLAHGRFWKPVSFGRAVNQYHPKLVASEIEALFKKLETLPEGFYWE